LLRDLKRRVWGCGVYGLARARPRTGFLNRSTSWQDLRDDTEQGHFRVGPTQMVFFDYCDNSTYLNFFSTLLSVLILANNEEQILALEIRTNSLLGERITVTGQPISWHIPPSCLGLFAFLTDCPDTC